MKKLNSVLVFIALAIAAATMIPFKLDTIGANEVTIKFGLFSVLVLLLAIAICVGKDKKVEGKKGFYSADLVISAYIASVFAYGLFFIIRSSVDIKYIILSCGGALIFTLFALSLPKYEHRKAIVIPLILFLIIISAGVYLYTNSEVGIILAENKEIALYASIALAVITTVLYIIEYLVMTKKLNETNMERDVVLYQEILDDNLKDIYDYSKNELQNRGIVFEETKVEVIKEIPVEKIVDREIVREVPVERVVEKEVEVVKEVPIPQYVEKEVIKEVPVIKEVEVIKEVPVVKEVEKIVEKVVEVIKEVPVEKEVEKVVVKEIPVEKIVEVVKEVPVDKVVQVIKEVPIEKVVEVEKKKAPSTAATKKKLVFKPTPSDLAIKAAKQYPDIEVEYGKDADNYKVMLHKKPIMYVASSGGGYKVTYQRKPISATKFMIKYPNSCQKASTPKGDQWFKITNKGEIEEKDMYDLIKFSYEYEVAAEKLAAEKKAKAEAKAKAAKEKAKQKEKEAKAKEKAKQKEAEEKAKAAALKAEEQAKAKEEAAKLKEAEANAKKAEAEKKPAAKKPATKKAAPKKQEVVNATPTEETAIAEVVNAEPVAANNDNASYVHTVTTTTITQTVETVEGANQSDLDKEKIKEALREVLAEKEDNK